jgi:hypothetical protein
MTIAFATKGDTFAILAADRLASINNADGTPAAPVEVCKIAFHSPACIACTAVGVGHLPPHVPDGTLIPITAHIHEILQTIRSPDDVGNIAAHIFQRLGPLIEKHRKGDQFLSHIAVVNHGKAEMALAIYQDGHVQLSPEIDRRLWSLEIDAYVRPLLPDLHKNALAKTTSPDDVGKMMVEIARGATRTESTSSQGKHQTIGLGVDTAIVTSKGVQFSSHGP